MVSLVSPALGLCVFCTKYAHSKINNGIVPGKRDPRAHCPSGDDSFQGVQIDGRPSVTMDPFCIEQGKEMANELSYFD